MVTKNKNILLSWACHIEEILDTEFIFHWKDTKSFNNQGVGSFKKDKIRKIDRGWLERGSFFYYIIYEKEDNKKEVVKFVKRYYTKKDLDSARIKAKQLKELLCR
jgi:hypothetical protein